MAEFIELEALLQDIGETVLFSVRGGAELPTPEMRGARKVIDRIRSQPAADVVEVRHGEWIEHIEKPEWLDDDVDIHYECSVCGASGIGKTPYCHHCGAKMDGKGEGE